MTESKNYLPAKADSHKPFYGWLILFGLMMFGAFLLWWHKLWHIVFTQDQTYLSGIIVVLFLLTTLYLGRCAWKISREQRFAEALLEAPSSENNESRRIKGGRAGRSGAMPGNEGAAAAQPE